MSNPSSHQPTSSTMGGGVGDFVEVYATDNDIAAGFVADRILAAQGIVSVKHDRRSRAIAAPAALPGVIAIAVNASDASRARQLIAEARTDGVLPDDDANSDDGSEEEEGIA